MKKMLCMAAALLIALAPFTAAVGELSRFKTSFFDVFDTYSEIVVYAQDQAAAQKMMDAAHTQLLEFHQLYDIYNLYDGVNNIKTINDNAGKAPVTVDQRIIDLVAFGKQMEAKSNGRKNIAMGSVLSIWHDFRQAGIDDPANAKLPDMAVLQAAAQHIDINNVVIDEAAKTIYLADPKMSLDVGSIAKGFSVERVAQSLIASGVTNAILSIGGNVRAIGGRGDGTAWRVGIQNPDLNASDQALTMVNLKDLSLVTSGSYQRYYTVDGKQYHHIIDPSTLMPAAYVRAVSVVTESSALGDALSMVLFNQPIESGKAFLKNYPNTEALWVTLDGQIVRSDGFSALAGEELANP